MEVSDMWRDQWIKPAENWEYSEDERKRFTVLSWWPCMFKARIENWHICHESCSGTQIPAFNHDPFLWPTWGQRFTSIERSCISPKQYRWRNFPLSSMYCPCMWGAKRPLKGFASRIDWTHRTGMEGIPNPWWTRSWTRRHGTAASIQELCFGKGVLLVFRMVRHGNFPSVLKKND